MPRPYRILAIGDSVIWGQGLLDQDKVVTRVQNWIQQFHPEFDVQKKILAHSAAIIGVGSTSKPPAVDQEVPFKFPTILQQVEAYPDPPQEVDLILISVGINNVAAFHLANPLTDEAELHAHIS